MGSPCVGKTTVSQQLATKLNGFHIDLSEIATKEKLTCGIDKNRETLIVDRARLSKRVQQIIREKGRSQNLIIDGHYATDVVPVKNVNKVFVLRRHPRELKKLMEERGFKERKTMENLSAEILDVCLCDALEATSFDKVCEVDLSGKTIEEVISEIVSILDEKKPCKVGIVDWLGELEKERNLDEFLTV